MMTSYRDGNGEASVEIDTSAIRPAAFESATAHWSQLLEKFLSSGSRRTFYTIAQAYAQRLKRKSPEELAMIVDSLRSAVKNADPGKESASRSEVSLLLEFLLELTIEMNYASSEQLAEKQWADFAKTANFKTIISLLYKSAMTNTALSKELNVTRSRVSQLLSTMQLANLIQFTQQGQLKQFTLTELGQACAAHLNSDSNSINQCAVAEAELHSSDVPSFCRRALSESTLEMPLTADSPSFPVLKREPTKIAAEKGNFSPATQLQEDSIARIKKIAKRIAEKMEGEDQSESDDDSACHSFAYEPEKVGS